MKQTDNGNTQLSGSYYDVMRNVTVAGRRTSVKLAPEIWEALELIVDLERTAMNPLITMIAVGRPTNSSLSGAIRIYIVTYLLRLVRNQLPTRGSLHHEKVVYLNSVLSKKSKE